MLLDHGRHRAIASPPPTIERSELTLAVERATDVPRPLVGDALAEAAAIWQPLGVSLTWRFVEAGDRGASPDELRLVVSDDVSESGNETRLGWIRFPAPATPEGIVHLSREAARRLLGTALSVRQKPLAWQDTLLARAMGRALAHEIGHYLLASELHSTRGLMRSTFSVDALTGVARAGFALSNIG